MAVWLSIMDSEQMAKVKDFKSERRPANCSVSHFSMLTGFLSILWPHELVWCEGRMKKVGGEDGE